MLAADKVVVPKGVKTHIKLSEMETLGLATAHA